jgi:hypothetical protein
MDFKLKETRNLLLIMHRIRQRGINNLMREDKEIRILEKGMKEYITNSMKTKQFNHSNNNQCKTPFLLICKPYFN